MCPGLALAALAVTCEGADERRGHIIEQPILQVGGCLGEGMALEVTVA